MKELVGDIFEADIKKLIPHHTTRIEKDGNYVEK